MFAKSKNDILYNSYETYIKSELKETIAEGEYLNDTDYKTLNLQEANLLTSLFNDYMNSDGYSVDTYYETGNFIKDYCRDFRELSGIKVEGVEDDNMEEKQAQVNDSTSIAKEKVINRVKHEEELYREKIINGKTYEEFKDSEETHIRNLIIEAIENGVANDEDYEILNSIKGSITDRIFDEYCNDMDANISDPVNCSVFIDNFCKSYNDVFKDRSEAEIEKLVYEKIYLKEFYEDFDRTGQEPASFNEFIDNEWREEEIRNRGYKALENYLRIKEQTVLIGVSETDTLYLYFKDSLNMKNFLQAKDEEGFHEDYVIASPVSYLLPEDYEEQNIQFVKIGRDITEEELNSENAIFYMEKAEAHLNPITATYYNNLCAIDIEEAIKDNYDGMHLKEGFENKIIELYGLERVKLVLASNVLENIDDGRFRNETKEWARSIRMMNSEYDRRQYRIRTHPEVLNGFIQRIIKNQKQEENTSENTNRFEIDNGFGEKITIEPTVELYNVKEPITETEKSGLAIQLWQVTMDDNGQEIKEPYALITKNFGEFIGVKNTAYIDINNCPFATQLLEKGIAEDTGATYRSGYVVYPLWEFKEEYLKKIGGENYEKYSQEFDDFIGNFNTKNNMEEEKEMPEKDEINEEKKVWLTAKVPDDVIIQTREKHTFMKMPETSEYAGYTFNLSNRMISSTTRLVDLESDSREQCLALVFGKDSIYTIRNRDEDEIELTGQAMYDLLENKKSSDFETKQDKSDWLNIIVPQEAMQGMYDNASLFFMPTNSDKKGYSYYIPNSLVKEDTSNDDGNFIISLPKEFEVHIKNKKTNDEMTISPNDLFDYCNNTKSKDYERIKQDKSEISQKSEETNEKDNGWVHASIPKEDCIAEYEKSRIYKMPNGKYEGYFYFLPNSFSRENVEKGTYTIGMPDDIKITLKDKEHNRELVIFAKEYVDALKVKREEKQEENVVGEVKKDDKKRFNFNNRKGKFNEAIAKNLREKVPEEMQQRNNWIAVCTIEDKEKGKTLKYLINAKDCTYAESDNPDTWTSFDEAIKFALEKGADAIAYALDGKDNIACIDLDHCKNENEELTPLAKEVIGKSGNTYSEFSVSGKGMHFFGKTQGMDVRTFSKDGDMEFYQKEHFITMTGDSAMTNKLESFDREEMKSLIEKKCEKRTIWKGQKQGVEGLSIMSDREIVERAMEGPGGETFKQLFLGVDIFNDHSRSDMSLMSRLTYYCNGDPEQTMRIFATSGLYRADKSPEYYECTLIKCIKGNTGRFQQSTYNAQPPKTKSGFNTK